VRLTTTTCDRCREVIHLGADRPEPVAGRLEGRLDDRPVDLCGDCTGRFKAWLRDTKKATRPGGPPPMPTAPGSTSRASMDVAPGLTGLDGPARGVG
jgi:hypothetical protein